jgi:hypothetical protein
VGNGPSGAASRPTRHGRALPPTALPPPGRDPSWQEPRRCVIARRGHFGGRALPISDRRPRRHRRRTGWRTRRVRSCVLPPIRMGRQELGAHGRVHAGRGGRPFGMKVVTHPQGPPYLGWHRATSAQVPLVRSFTLTWTRSRVGIPLSADDERRVPRSAHHVTSGVAAPRWPGEDITAALRAPDRSRKGTDPGGAWGSIANRDTRRDAGCVVALRRLFGA